MPKPTIRLAMELVYRHNGVTRFTHWINAIALMVLFMSGLQIFNAFPQLYWGSKAELNQAFLSISAKEHDGDVRGYTEILGYRLDTTGVLGVQFTESGPFPRAFPSWITIPGYYWLADGRRWHFFFGWVFVLNGVLYFVYNLLNGHLRKFLFTPRDAVKVPRMVLYNLHLRHKSRQEDEYNPLQKLAYTSVFLILTPLVLLTGLAQLDVAFHWLPAVFGGWQSARSIHFILAFGVALFTFGHVCMVLTTGFLNNMRSMVTGWYREKVSSTVEVISELPTIPATEPGTLTPALEEIEGKTPADDRSPRTANRQPPAELRWQRPALGLSRSHNMRVMSMKNQNRNISLRKILIGSLQAAGLLLISGCEKSFNGLQENKNLSPCWSRRRKRTEARSDCSRKETSSLRNLPSKTSRAISKPTASRPR